MSSNPPRVVRRQSTFKQVDVGQAVILDDKFMVANHRALQLESITLETMHQAEKQALAQIEAAKEEANQIIQSAQAEASRILEEDGIQKRDEILQQAFEEGYQAGLTHGIEHISQQLADKIQVGDKMVEQAIEAQRQLLDLQKTKLVELVRYILDLVIGEVVQAEPSRMLQLIEKAIENLQVSEGARILLNPEALKKLKSLSPDIVNALINLKRINLVPDMACGLSEMYLETMDGVFDISPQNQAECFVKAIAPDLLATEEPIPEDLADSDLEEAAVLEASPDLILDDSLSQEIQVEANDQALPAFHAPHVPMEALPAEAIPETLAQEPENPDTDEFLLESAEEIIEPPLAETDPLP